MDKAKKMMQSIPSFVKDTSDIEEHAVPSAQVLPAQSTRCSKSETLCFSKEQSHCSEDGWIANWDLYSFCVFESVDYLRSYRRLNSAMKKGTEVFQSESQRKPQVSPGDVESYKDKDTEEPDQPSPSLLREKGLDLATCDGGDCPDQDPVSDSSRHLGCWAWLQRAFGQKKK
ncbi:uncharacterized protein LOC236546 [Mus musculus]|uniref:2 cell stage variable group member 2A n=1 Tax=Mus musculus TaxID=10090 RepID=O70616_MOUSE|nr:uncharacterized protein LOC236546 [Mus musculus]NP_951015.1 uncharacterized protein LOC236546 [Mus musculus]AAC18351.1 unknown [Mus musculus]AAC18352.1 unknown [Mus musculus]AAI15952.1 AF067061 protein [Mus musculus]|eukprot:NP_001297556.1 uncharacterized protein LOC236546 [Mus musculus]